MESREDRKKRLREKLAESIDYSTEKTDEEIQQLIDEILMKESKTAPLSLAERVQLRRELFHAIRKLDVLQDLVDDGHITEIMINGPENIFQSASPPSRSASWSGSIRKDPPPPRSAPPQSSPDSGIY